MTCTIEKDTLETIQPTREEIRLQIYLLHRLSTEYGLASVYYI